MSLASSCPPTERLRQLLSGEVPDVEQADLVAHLDDCVACQRTLESLAGANPALLGAAGSLRRTAFAEEAPLRRVLDDLGNDPNLTTLYHAPDQAAWVQSLLRPVESADILGQFGDYEVTELLGQGGMGLVLKGFDAALKRWVAIKVLAPSMASDRVARQRFAREAQAAAAVRHEHVVTIHAVSEYKGLPFFVMEFVAGGSLQDYLDSQGPPDWRTIARLGAEIAAGLAAAHEQGIIHRDLKPANILLAADQRRSTQIREDGIEEGVNSSSPHGEGLSGSPICVDLRLSAAKITDFGVARVADEARLTRTGIVPGTPMYMAPEQALSEPLDHRADLFSLGSVLYALCTGREPFPATTPMAVLRQVCETTPPPLREINPRIPDWLAAVIERLHAKRPDGRFATAAEVAALLRYNLAHPDEPRPMPPASAPTRPHPTRRRFLMAVVCIVLLLVGGLLLSESFHWTHFFGRGSLAATGEDGIPLRATLRGHEGPVWALAFAPDGRTLATGSDDARLRIWDAATGRQVAELPRHSSAILSVAFAHSGKFLLSGGGDGTLRLWDVATRRELSSLPSHGGNLRRAPLAPDDQTVAVANSSQGVELWDLSRREWLRTLEGRHGTIMALAFAPDGQTLATGDTSGFIGLWDPATATIRARFQGDQLGVRALAFAPDSRTLAAAGSGDKDVKLWNVATQQRLATLPGYENGVQSMAISPDGRLLATGGRDGVVRIWDLPSAAPLATLHAHQGTVWVVAFSPDSHTLATAGDDRLSKLWDLSNLESDRRQ